MITQSYKLNIVPYAEQTVRGMTSPKVPVSQYDKGLRTLVFDLYDGSERMTIPAGQTAKIYGKKPDANVFEYDMIITEDRQSVSIVLQEQMAVIAGCVECEVRIFQGAATIGSANFTLIVEPAPVGADEVYSESEIPEIDNLLYGGTAGQVFTKTPTGAHWADLGTSSDFMLKSVYDPNDDGSVLKADHADDAGTVDGHTVARDVLANEYTNEQIDSMMQAAGTVKTVNSVQPDQNGNVQIGKSDIGLGNVDNTSDASKPISTATQAALDLKVDKVSGKGLSTNDYTDADKTKLGDLPTNAELTAELAGKVDMETGKGLSTNDFTDAEKTKLQDIEAGAQVNTVTGVKGSAEQTYRTGNIDITKANIGLGDVDNTSDADKPISTATQTALDDKVDKVAGKGLSENDYTTAEKEKLSGIASGAEVNVQANWNEADSTSDAFIQNKPSIPAKTSDLQNDSGFITGVNWGSIGGTLADQIDLNNELTALNTGLSSAVKSVNTETPDANGNVDLDATDIPTSSGVAIKSLTGNPLTIADALQGRALGLSVNIEPIQSGSGDPSPTNIRPISGISSLEIARTGHNIWDEQWELGGISENTGQNTSDTDRLRSVNYISVKPDTLYYFNDAANHRIFYYDSSKNFLSATSVYGYADLFRTPSNCFYIRFFSAGTTYNNDISINYPATVTTYEPYTGQAVAVSLGQTVYGGTLNVSTGELVVDSELFTATADGSWRYDVASDWHRYVYKNNLRIDTDLSKLLCNIAPTVTQTVGFGITRSGGGFIQFWVDDLEITSLADWNSYITNNNIQICYGLQTPLEIALTPAQLNLLASTNILTTNAEDLTVRYYATGQQGNVEGNIAFLLGQTGTNASAINSLTVSVAPEETSPATATHASGTYLMYQNRLYKAIDSIAVGETLTVGTNIQATTIMEELLALTA